jgi:hypothetical protein
MVKINAGETTIADLEVTSYLLEKELDFSVTGYEINIKPLAMKVNLFAD